MAKVNDFMSIRVPPDGTIRATIELIDASAMQIALVVAEDGRLLGTVTDGDIRRGMLAGVQLEDPVAKVMNWHPSVCQPRDEREVILARMRAKRLRHLPVVDDNGCLVGLETLDELQAQHERDNIVVLMAGGLGMRLRPLTEDCPKPMLNIGGRPILETILMNFLDCGYRRFYISVNFKAEAITEYFGDGSRWGASIGYLHESQKLGTAGALSLLDEVPNSSFLVMNGDLLTKVDFSQLLEFHREHKAQATMCVREYDFQVPYGVVRLDGQRIGGIDEKPVQRFFVNAGIYALEPEVLEFLPRNSFFDMTSLFDKLIAENRETVAFPIREYWLDIGQLADYDRANGEFAGIFAP